MASWDDEDFEPEIGVKDTSILFADEDNEDVLDNWDDLDEDDDEEEKKKAAALAEESLRQKKKKALQDKIKEKEQAQLLENLRIAEEKRKQDENGLVTEEERKERERSEKDYQIKLQKDSDLQLAREALGITDDLLENDVEVLETLPTVSATVNQNRKTIDNCTPTTKAEFAGFNQLLIKKLSSLEGSKEYSAFLENFIRDCCIGLSSADIRKISTNLSALAAEKQKQAKAVKTKAKPAIKGTVSAGKGSMGGSGAGSGKGAKNISYDDYDDGYDDYDDFM